MLEYGKSYLNRVWNLECPSSKDDVWTLAKMMKLARVTVIVKLERKSVAGPRDHGSPIRLGARIVNEGSFSCNLVSQLLARGFRCGAANRSGLGNRVALRDAKCSACGSHRAACCQNSTLVAASSGGFIDRPHTKQLSALPSVTVALAISKDELELSADAVEVRIAELFGRDLCDTESPRGEDGLSHPSPNGRVPPARGLFVSADTAFISWV